MPAKKPRALLTCLQCGAAFEVHPCEAALRKHCSKRCHNDSMARDNGNYRGHAGGTKSEHIRLVEGVLGRALPDKAEIHHVNGNRRDNRHGNLVVCENHTYHMLLHVRARVIREGGNPNTDRICSGCKRLVLIKGFGSGAFGASGSPRRVCLRCNAANADIRRRRAGIARSEVGRKYDEMQLAR